MVLVFRSPVVLLLALVVAGAGVARAQEAVPPPEKGAVDEPAPDAGPVAADAPAAEAALVVEPPPEPPAPGPPPLWRDPWVAERAPNLYGQTGVVRVTSARAGRGGQFDVALHGRYHYSSDFIGPQPNDVFEYANGYLSAGFTAFDLIELGFATDFATLKTNAQAPQTFVGIGNFYPSLKLGVTFLPVAFGVDVRGHVPSQLLLVEQDFGNFAIATTGLFTLDVYEGWGIPVKVHLNGGYVYQNGGHADERYYLAGLGGAFAALANDVWYYDHLLYGAAVEVPLPVVTPYVELFGQTALGVRPGDGGGGTRDYDYLGDSVVTATPGLRGTIAKGLHVDLAVDVGVGGTAGFLSPSLDAVVDGQPLNFAWAARVGMSFTFDPYAPTTVVGGGGPGGTLSGCVVDEAGAPVADAVVSIAEADARLATDARGCWQLRGAPLGRATVAVSGAGVEPASGAATVAPDETTKLDLVVKRAAPTSTTSATSAGTFAGVVVSDGDEAIEATVDVVKQDGEVVTTKAQGGLFSVEVPAGEHRAIARAEGYLLQGARVVVEPGGRAARTFVLKRAPKKRAATLTKDRIETTAIVPFEFGKPRLLRAAEFVLDDVVDVLLFNPQIALLRVEGTADEGDAPGLAAARAQAVVDYLVARGVDPRRLEARAAEGGKGKRIEFVVAKETGDRPAPAGAAAEESKKKKGR